MAQSFETIYLVTDSGLQTLTYAFLFATDVGRFFNVFCNIYIIIFPLHSNQTRHVAIWTNKIFVAHQVLPFYTIHAFRSPFSDHFTPRLVGKCHFHHLLCIHISYLWML